jgi:hypothetical protein
MGAETRSTNVEQTGGAISTANPRTPGTAHFRSSSAGLTGAPSANFVTAMNTTVYARIYYYMSAQFSGTGVQLSNLARFSNASGGAAYLAQLNDGTGRICLVIGVTTAWTSGNDYLAAGVWHKVELAVRVNSAGGATSYVEARINGSTVYTTNTANIAASALSSFGGGDAPADSGATVDTDDIAVNDDTGTSQNTWCGDGIVTILLPASDDAASNVGVDAWRAGNTASTNLFDAVNNTPPTGAASPGTTGSQIVCDTPSVARTYIAVTETYDTKLVASDTIAVIVGVVVHGESVSTGTKTGAIGYAANAGASPPADLSITFGGGVGAVGAFPTNWQVDYMAPSYPASVTRSSGAKIKVTCNTSTRNVDVCFMALIVEYAPAATTPVPKPTIIQQAVQRATSR